MLIGGLNGVGKTTLLDALQLVLYGKQAKCSNRGALGYDAFLSRCINRGVDPGEGAGLEIQFRHVAEGREQVYRVHRSWRQNGNGIKERLEVLRNGSFDRLLTDSWAEFADEFIPSRLAHLFFFDGEQIESLADLANAANLIQSAIFSLLGLDLVDRVSSDLIVLERRKRASVQQKTDRTHIEALQSELRELKGNKDELVQQGGSAQNLLELKQKQLEHLENEIAAAGGGLFEQRSLLESQRADLASKIGSLEEDLRELSAGAAPLLLVRTLLERTFQQVEQEKVGQQAEALGETLRERDESLVRLAAQAGVAARQLTAISDFLEQDRKTRTRATCASRYLNVSSEGEQLLPNVLLGVLPECQSRAEELLLVLEQVRSAQLDIERKLAAVPDEATLAPQLSRRQELLAAVSQVSAHIEIFEVRSAELRGQIRHKEARLQSLLEIEAKESFEKDDRQRFILHSERVRTTLLEFRRRVVSQHIRRIEELVLDSFRQLLRKRRLVASLRINEETFALELEGADGRPLSSERLSAGERQLLAVSLLWGLARASGRPLPAVIDTPLGRLDSSHRRHLVERYFPYASHQVLLLSTDEEIRGEYYQKLTRWIGHSYRLDFDDTQNATRIEVGYLEGIEGHGH